MDDVEVVLPVIHKLAAQYGLKLTKTEPEVRVILVRAPWKPDGCSMALTNGAKSLEAFQRLAEVWAVASKFGNLRRCHMARFLANVH